MELYKFKIKLINFIWILFLSASVFGQGINIKEYKLFELNNILKISSILGDSLQVELDALLDIIDSEKNKESINQGYVSGLLANALVRTNKLDAVEIEIKNINSEINSVKKNLYESYSTIIDSLKQLEQSNYLDVLNKIKLFSTKKLSVSPILSSLSFNPDIIEKIDLQNNFSEEERSIYLSYLYGARNEVDSIVVLIEHKSKDIEEIIRLNEMAEDFIDEIDNISFSGSISILAEEGSIKSGSFDNIYDPSRIISINHTLQPFVFSNIETSSFIEIKSIVSQDYLNLLIETGKTLRLYSDLIMDKINQKN